MARAASLILITGLLAACSTADVLTVDATPPETVGNAPAQYSPPAVAAAPPENVARQTLAPPSSSPQQSTYGTAPQQSYPSTASSAPAYDATPGVGRQPSTFGAQAANLAPAQPAYTPPQQTAPQTAAATPAQPAPAAQPSAASASARTAASPSASARTAASPSASIAAAETLRFLPIIGAPSDKLQPLSARLGESARAAGLSIVAMDDEAADLSLKGYFSAVDQEGVVSVIYVWDVIGANGVRLHRIQDRQASKTGGFSGSDPWAGVSADMMAAIGQKSIGSLLAWLDTQG